MASGVVVKRRRGEVEGGGGEGGVVDFLGVTGERERVLSEGERGQTRFLLGEQRTVRFELTDHEKMVNVHVAVSVADDGVLISKRELSVAIPL